MMKQTILQDLAFHNALTPLEKRFWHLIKRLRLGDSDYEIPTFDTVWSLPILEAMMDRIEALEQRAKEDEHKQEAEISAESEEPYFLKY